MVTIPTTYQTGTGVVATALADIDNIAEFTRVVSAALALSNTFWFAASGSNLGGAEFFAIFDELNYDGVDDDSTGFCHLLRKRILKELYDLKLYFPSGAATNTPTYPSDYDIADAGFLTDDVLNGWWTIEREVNTLRQMFITQRDALAEVSANMSSAEIDAYYEAAFFDGVSTGVVHEQRIVVVEAIANIRLHANAQ